MDDRFETARGTVVLRPEQPGDHAFLYALFQAHTLPALAALPLDEAEQEALVRLQFRAQATAYRSQFPDAEFAIIEREGELVGRLILDQASSAACIVDFALMPAVQNGGLGTAIMRRIIDRMANVRTSVRCKVLLTNTPSLRMCQRLGFVHIGDELPFLQLEWRGAAAASGGCQKPSLNADG